MSSSRENSPDWLRSYQAPYQSAVILSSDSGSPLTDDEDEMNLSRLFKKEPSPVKIEDDQVEEVSGVNETLNVKSPSKKQKPAQTPARKRRRELLHENEGGYFPQSNVNSLSNSASPPSDDEDEMNLGRLLKKEQNPVKIEDDQVKEVSGVNKALNVKSLSKKQKADQTLARKRRRDLLHENEGEKETGGQPLEAEASKKPIAFPVRSFPKEQNHSVWALSSDSESCRESKPVNVDVNCVKRYPLSEYLDTGKDEGAILDDDGESPLEISPAKTPKKQLKRENKALTVESVNAFKNGGNTGDMDVGKDIIEKRSRPNALVECEGDSIDLSGDVGAVGRIEAIVNDFIQLRPLSNVYEAETMVEGTLVGFSFDSDDDADDLSKSALPTNQNEDAEEQSNGKTKKKTQKASGPAGKKAKTAGGKPAKRVRKKSQAPKKSKTKK
ncbi:hypothetical protein M9H77_26261 [Catharanthus roseus]|uniref:Uncharacterized protein n=1 Tax=Catharanthus roseus TaxID=4058 RepID=A0ACC0ABV0_CATRO|nr:hypothetical protein M9H77_26261 [Catharanthus roseus]